MSTPYAPRPGVVARLRAAIPSEPPSPPIRYTPGLVAYVASVSLVAVVLAAVTVRAPFDISTLLFGVVVIAGLGAMLVRSIGGADAAWSPLALVHLTLSLALGPSGALVSAVVASAATAVRMQTGWLRALFNAANFFLINMAAWSVFHGITHLSGSRIWLTVAGGLAAGAASYIVNHAVLFGLLTFTRHVGLRDFMRGLLGVLFYDLSFGLAAAAFVTLYDVGSTVYLAMGLMPVVTMQAFMVNVSVQTNARDAERERHARERVGLLQRIITAADDERFKTASDLHDGPVAHLSGLALMLSAAAQSTGDLPATVEEAADELRDVQRELRTHIFALSPHDLDKPGRLREEVEATQLAALRERGVDAEATIPDTLPLGRLALELVHRACREALANVLRHAGARQVAVAIDVGETDVVLTVGDDGRGFSAQDVERQRAAGHFGTRFLAEKAEALGGSFDVTSEPGSGTHVRLSLPVENKSS